MSFQSVNKLMRRLRQIESEMERMDRRLNNIVREGEIIETFPEEGMVRVESNGMKSRKIPWMTRSGTIQHWSPPSKGERVMMISPTGEPGNGIAMPGGYSDEFSENHDKDDEDVRTIGNTKVHQKDGQIKFTIGSATHTFTESNYIMTIGGVTTTFSTEGFSQDGGHMTHDGKGIDAHHTHGGILPGGANTAVPNDH